MLWFSLAVRCVVLLYSGVHAMMLLYLSVSFPRAASCGPNSRQQQQQPAAALSSGGHSHNCKSQDVTDGDEREVASALKAGGACVDVFLAMHQPL